MLSRRPLVLIALAVLLALPLFFYMRTIVRAGEWTTLQPVFEGSCENWSLASEVRAVRLLDRTGRLIVLEGGEAAALVALSPAQAVIARTPLGRGEARAMSLDDAGRVWIASEEEGGAVFTPYRFDGAAFVEEGAAVGPIGLTGALGGFVVQDGVIFLTDTGVARPGSQEQMRAFSRMRRDGQLIRVDGAGQTVLADDLAYPGGVAVSGARLFVAETHARALRTFALSAGAVATPDALPIFVGTFITSLSSDAEGRIFASAQPKYLRYLRFLKGERQDAPAQVIVIEPGAQRIDQIYLAEETGLAAVRSVDVNVEARRLVMANGAAPVVQSCTLPEVWRHSESHPRARPQ